MNTRIEGYWYNQYNATEYPIPVANELPFVGKDYFLSNLSKLENIAKVVYYKGFSICRICNCRNGNREFNLGGWTWPEGYKHYIEEHNISPSQDFMVFVINNGKSI